MKKIIISFAILIGILTYSQVGVNTSDAKATLDVTAKTTDGSKAEGVIAPRLTGDALKAAETAAVYSTAQNGAIVYVTAAATTPGTGQVQNVTATGYYYFDATANKWIALKETAWYIKGNSGTVAGTNFLGTTDNVDLVFKRSNIIAGALKDNGNTSFGARSFPSVLTSTQTHNTAIGWGTMRGSVNGSNNTAIGSGVLIFGSGTGNTAVGRNALSSNSSGNYNVALGFDVLVSSTSGTENIALGKSSMYKNVGGNYNIGIGTDALNLADGSISPNDKNIAIGNSALNVVDPGSSNIGIGENTSTNGISNIVIGNNTSVNTGDNQMNIGNAIFGTGMTGTLAAPAGNIGINTSGPNSTLEVAGSMATAITTMSTGTIGNTATVVATGNITLPSASAGKNRIYTIYLGTTSTVTITGSISYLGGTSASWNLDNTSGNRGIILQSNGTNWVIVGRLN